MSAARQATILIDRQLASSARMIAAQARYGAGVYSVSIPLAALDLFASDSHDQIAYAVFDPDGLLIAGYPGFEPPSDASKLEPRFFQTVFRGRSVRAVALRRPVITPDSTRSVSVIVGETLTAHNRLLRKFWLHTFLEEAALVLAASVAIWIGINRELRPLVRLRQAVLGRPVDGLEPFDPGSVPSELRPLVSALDNDMKWLGQLRRQRRFLESAAHQLRTPLAIMKTQVGYARRTGTQEEISAMLRQIDENLTSMGRLTSQLLALGRVEHEQATQQLELVDLVEVARDVVAEAAPRGLDQGVELVFDPGAACPVMANATLVRELVRNLVDNAVRHAGAGATAVVSVHASGAAALLRVDDDGVGVGQAGRAQLAGRFSRAGKNSPEGSGLGLSIVAEIAEIYGGSLDLPIPRRGHGFCAVVRFPLAYKETARPYDR